MVVVIGFSLDNPGQGIPDSHPYWDRELVASLTASIEKSRRSSLSGSGERYHFHSDHSLEFCELVITESPDGAVNYPGEHTLSWITVRDAPGGSGLAEYLSDSLVLTDYGSMLMDLLHFENYLSDYFLRIPELAQKNSRFRKRMNAVNGAIYSSWVVPFHPKLPQALRALDSYPRIEGYLNISHLKRMVKCSSREARLIRRDLDRLGLLDSHIFYHNGRTSEESSFSYKAIRELGGGEAIAQMIEGRKLPDGSSVSASFGHR